MGPDMQIDYFLLDVFTDTPLAGNPLAVVVDADRLSDDSMQKIAKEFNLSETVFLMEPKVGRHTALARIFTPNTELPFAGHPTIGAAVLLGLQKRATAIRLEEKIGLITCVMEKINRKTGEAHFKLPKTPEETGPAPTNTEIAETLGVPAEAIGHNAWQPERFSAGLEFTIVPVRDEQVLSEIKLERRGWRDVYGDDHGAVYVFTPTRGDREFDFAARMFQPSLALGEDAATGSAVAALIGYIAKNGDVFKGQKSYMVRQGVEMGRPSRIEMQIGFANGELVHAGIGGKAVLIGEGQIDLENELPISSPRPIV